MNRFNMILLPFALLFGACDAPDEIDLDAEAEANVEAVAAAPAGKGKRGHGGRMAKLDADKDGAISLAEAQGTRLADNFTKVDSDADGKLTRDELRAMKGERGGKHGRRGGGEMFAQRDADNSGTLSLAEVQGTRLADKFAALDANKDGALAKDELGRGRHGRRGGGEMFAQRDADNNGTLSQAEVQGSRLADRFAALDANKDGALAKDELMAMKRGGRGKDPAERAGRILGKRDADNSGTLSLAELEGSRMADKFGQIDRDSDGVLSRDELVAFRPAREHRGHRDGK